MQWKLIDILACIKCSGSLECVPSKEEEGEILEGTLTCVNCQEKYLVTNGIPRFVKSDNYASSFGYQWNLFRKEQLDTYNGTDLSAKRVYSETGWTKEWLRGKWILDCGCGAGRFLDVISKNECEAVGIDISSAIDASKINLAGRKNVHLIQASIYELPFKDGVFDGCYCIGVIQHTPDPAKTLSSLPRVVKEDGEVVVTIYERRKWYTVLFSKYLIRPVTKKIPQKTLLNIIKGSMPVLFPVTDVLFRLPVIGKAFAFAIPIANYVNEPALTKDQRYAWAILDTFDMLSPQYDQPQVESEVKEVLSSAGVDDIRRLPNPGLNLKGKRKASHSIDESK